MRTFKWIFIAISSSLLLASCAITPKSTQSSATALTASQPAQSWSTRVESLSKIHSWDLKGKIAIRTPKDSVSASWQWQQTAGNYTIQMFGPLGSGSFKLAGSPGNVSMQTSDGKTASSSSPETLLVEQLGWHLPVSSMRYWIRGLPVPKGDANKSLDDRNHLTVLKQQGWVIQYLDYTTIGNVDLPTKIYLNNPQLDAKIVIKQWKL
jgi:outer membrane lipoprotein LolB